jgi:hypothetical protein
LCCKIFFSPEKQKISMEKEKISMEKTMTPDPLPFTHQKMPVNN